jgi:hypothetical protein
VGEGRGSFRGAGYPVSAVGRGLLRETRASEKLSAIKAGETVPLWPGGFPANPPVRYFSGRSDPPPPMVGGWPRTPLAGLVPGGAL